MRSFLTGLEPLLEKVAMGEQLPLPLGRPAPAAAPGLLSRAGGALGRGGRMLGQAASQGIAGAGRALSALPAAGKWGLGAAAALGAGGLAYGALRQHEDDARLLPQVHVPMTGSIYG